MVESIKLNNIRCFKEAVFDFSPDLNLIVGPNGGGKTSLLESVVLFSFAKFGSLLRDSYAIRFGSDLARVELKANEDGREILAEAVITSGEKIFKVNSNRIPASKMIGKLKIVYFNPETIDLVSGSPGIRRRELDQIIGQVDPVFIRALLRYKKVLKERNSLLKRIAMERAQAPELSFWDDEVTLLAGQIFLQRQAFIERINESLPYVHSKLIGDRSDLKVKYLPSCRYDRFEEELAASREGDIRSSQTGVGPHRDDFEFSFKNKNRVVTYRDQASRGEQRLAALALKIATADYLFRTTKSRPIIILDDIFSELDERHRELIFSVVEAGQVFISATDEGTVPIQILTSSNKILVNKNE